MGGQARGFLLHAVSHFWLEKVTLLLTGLSAAAFDVLVVLGKAAPSGCRVPMQLAATVFGEVGCFRVAAMYCVAVFCLRVTAFVAGGSSVP
jgi:hypothetical protein